MLYEPKGRTQVGNSNSGLDTLYGHYLKWCRINNIEPPIKINIFSELLLEHLKTLKWKVSKKRLSAGFFVIGVKINEPEELRLIKELLRNQPFHELDFSNHNYQEPNTPSLHLL